MFLKVITPSPPLDSFIQRMWIFESMHGLPVEDLRVVVPNGQMKLIIPYKNGLKSRINDIHSLAKESSIGLIGLADVPAIIDSQTDQETGTIGIEFKPLAAYRFFNLPLNELTNQVYQIDDVLGREGADLQRMLGEVNTHEERIERIEAFLFRRLQHNSAPDLLIEYAVGQITDASGKISIHDLATKTGYSKRYLEMKFQEKVGLSPKTFASIIRFQKFYKAWGRYRENRLFETDFYEYFYDQSHFIKEFRRFTGYSPTKFIKNDNEFGRIFYKE